MKKTELNSLRDALRKFAAARDWDQFHTPKNLAAAMAVEASEVLEHFQWLSPEQSLRLQAKQKDAVALELADVLNYLVRLADKLDVDLIAAARRKIKINARKYPAERSRGSMKKYSTL
jgi:dCTP diphosphatase